jgi:hypothetical protein
VFRRLGASTNTTLILSCHFCDVAVDTECDPLSVIRRPSQRRFSWDLAEAARSPGYAAARATGTTRTANETYAATEPEPNADPAAATTEAAAATAAEAAAATSAADKPATAATSEAAAPAASATATSAAAATTASAG